MGSLAPNDDDDIILLNRYDHKLIVPKFLFIFVSMLGVASSIGGKRTISLLTVRPSPSDTSDRVATWRCIRTQLIFS